MDLTNLFKSVADKTGAKAVTRLDVVDVRISIDKQIVGEYASALYGTAMSLLNNNVVDMIPSELELTMYIEHLVKYRVLQVTGNHLPIKPSSREWIIPAGFFPILAMIGSVTNKEESVKVNVVCPFKDKELQTLNDFVETETFKKVRNFFELSEDKISVARGLPRDEEGHYEFMMFQLIDEQLKHHSKDVEPAAVLAASFIRAETTQTIFNPRFIYGNKNDYRTYVRELARGRMSV